jgi:tetratricopeptide (TPR) repeat protein
MNACIGVLLGCGLLTSFLSIPAPVQASTSAYVGWGNELLAQKNYKSAAEYFEAALKKDPRDFYAYRGLGYAYLEERDIVRGVRYMGYALELNPADASLRNYLAETCQIYGNWFYQRRDIPSAMAWWKQAIKINPGNAPLAAYLSSHQEGSRPPVPNTASGGPVETIGPSHGVNPWILGSTVAVLGAIMLFAF